MQKSRQVSMYRGPQPQWPAMRELDDEGLKAIAQEAGGSGDWVPCKDDPDLWHSDLDRDVQEAKRRCGWCPVKARCLQVALANHEPYGTWGGQSEAEREAIFRAEAQRKRELQRALELQVQEVAS